MKTVIFLALNALILFGWGAATFSHPIEVMSQLGMDATGPHASYELRGVYGGVSIAAGLLCMVGVFQQTVRRPALIFLLTYTGGYALSRIAALPLDGPPLSYFYIFIVYEFAVAILALYLLWSASSEVGNRRK